MPRQENFINARAKSSSLCRSAGGGLGFGEEAAEQRFRVWIGREQPCGCREEEDEDGFHISFRVSVFWETSVT